jgi:hypothetical protein
VKIGLKTGFTFLTHATRITEMISSSFFKRQDQMGFHMKTRTQFSEFGRENGSVGIRLRVRSCRV